MNKCSCKELLEQKKKQHKDSLFYNIKIKNISLWQLNNKKSFRTSKDTTLPDSDTHKCNTAKQFNEYFSTLVNNMVITPLSSDEIKFDIFNKVIAS